MTIPVGRYATSEVSMVGTATPNNARVGVTFRYETTDPWAVTAKITFKGDFGQLVFVEWVFARDLLADGLLRETGEGDVQVEPDADNLTVLLHLDSPSGHAVIELDMETLGIWVDRIYQMVPADVEDRFFDSAAFWEDLTRGCSE